MHHQRSTTSIDGGPKLQNVSSIRRQVLSVTSAIRERERESEFHLSIQPALAYEDTSMLESSAKVRVAELQLSNDKQLSGFGAT